MSLSFPFDISSSDGFSVDIPVLRREQNKARSLLMPQPVETDANESQDGGKSKGSKRSPRERVGGERVGGRAE
jgi:hypothetical protein